MPSDQTSEFEPETVALLLKQELKNDIDVLTAPL